MLVQPGHADESVTISIGYGRNVGAEVNARGCGVDVYPIMTSGRWFEAGASLEKAGHGDKLAITQEHWNQEGRPIALEVANRAVMQKHLPIVDEVKGPVDSMYEPHKYTGFQWAMAIDLNKCTGCSACVIACVAENNIPVVGREMVKRSREMQWIRIDVYFQGPVDEPTSVQPQPMMCVHCEKAPCEYVCPVNATVHSDEGLNEMVYNRCIGTRYCSNNCPYKVRRFNFLDYHPNVQDIARMGMNPDVTVRSRGVMEKCTYCVQRIERARIDARVAGRELADGEFTTACAQACPSKAIVFGSLHDKASRSLARSRRPARLRRPARARHTPAHGAPRSREEQESGAEQWLSPRARSTRRSLPEPLIQGPDDDLSITDSLFAPVWKPTMKGWWMLFLPALAGTGMLFTAIAYTVWKGIGVWGNNIPVAWAFGIINFVWWIGIGHAGTLISAILLLFQQKWRTSINRFSEAMTLFAVMCAGALSRHPHRTTVVRRLLALPVSVDARHLAAVPLAADVGRLRGLDLLHHVAALLVPRPSARPRVAARSLDEQAGAEDLRHLRRSAGAASGRHWREYSERLLAARRPGDAAGALGPHDRVLRLRHVAAARLAHDDLPALLRRRRRLLGLRDGRDAASCRRASSSGSSTSSPCATSRP